ncbi:galactokinase [Shewanella sp. UCD-KL12]|uniref:galactokinase n=1 Tax=Shewanella sp. UCD-KL12 TaxID=1917163 RepID=UPI0009F95F38|nr:galactokinase [Shewanella sp. UCD-KL12]
MSSLTIKAARAEQAFILAYGSGSELQAYAPGRVNLIGDHTDYNQGFVLPVAIDMGTTVLAAKRSDNLINVIAMDMGGERVSFRLEQITFDEAVSWSNYVRGSILCLLQALRLNDHDKDRAKAVGGADLLIHGNIPQGSGLSSSASLEIAVLKAMSDLYGLGIDGVQAAKLGQQAENEFVGCNCGIMDQLISALGQDNRAMLLDCRDLSYRYAALPDDVVMVIINSNVQRDLVESEYNLRRQQCDEAAEFFDRPSLRDVSVERLCAVEGQLESTLYRRARHVISENARTERTFDALKSADFQRLSQLMSASHASLRDDFEVTTPEIDFLVAVLAERLGCEGGVRMTGGGFGGCVIALVPKKHVVTVEETVAEHYQVNTGLTADVYVCSAQAGAFNR